MPDILPRANGRRRYIVDPMAFFLALFGAPILVAALCFWALFIPVFAVIYGGPLYLAAGTPALLWALPRFGPNSLTCAALAFAIQISICGCAWVWMEFTDGPATDLAHFFLIFGAAIAPLWGWAFAVLYRAFERSAFRRLNMFRDQEGVMS
ncbi:hypothetical protein E4Z66_18405 [Aliishimia ponticola]|uniref:Uncharacterized protein n=1 Tax=Aliishimia ponticola TaxID=2499833 RepID=A0A4S4N5N9_9RHOB|nr:hypothetical protein [Aliishimia ponticola]THH34409.1 hypothetical protein E4Z66_18405 [Aliishimia ponticola]